MNAPEQKITREELHRLVWTRTFVKLATELGYTYPELAAICEDLNIPRPRGGYWNRLELGTAEAQEPLPPAPPGKPTEIPRGPHKASEKAAAETQEAPAPLAHSENDESESGENITTPPDVAADKPKATSIPSIPHHGDVPTRQGGTMAAHVKIFFGG